MSIYPAHNKLRNLFRDAIGVDCGLFGVWFVSGHGNGYNGAARKHEGHPTVLPTGVPFAVHAPTC